MRRNRQTVAEEAPGTYIQWRASSSNADSSALTSHFSIKQSRYFASLGPSSFALAFRSEDRVIWRPTPWSPRRTSHPAHSQSILLGFWCWCSLLRVCPATILVRKAELSLSCRPPGSAWSISNADEAMPYPDPIPRPRRSWISRRDRISQLNRRILSFSSEKQSMDQQYRGANGLVADKF